MIQAILIFNNHGKPRLTKFYDFYVSIEYDSISMPNIANR